MAEVGIPGEEDFHELDKYNLRMIANCTSEELARANRRIEELTRKGVIQPNAFDPLDRGRTLRWPKPVPRDSTIVWSSFKVTAGTKGLTS